MRNQRVQHAPVLQNRVVPRQIFEREARQVVALQERKRKILGKLRTRGRFAQQLRFTGLNQVCEVFFGGNGRRGSVAFRVHTFFATAMFAFRASDSAPNTGSIILSLISADANCACKLFANARRVIAECWKTPPLTLTFAVAPSFQSFRNTTSASPASSSPASFKMRAASGSPSSANLRTAGKSGA